MAVNNKFFIETLSEVLNALSNLSAKFECRLGSSQTGEPDGDNYFMRIKCRAKLDGSEKDFEITAGSNSKVYLTFPPAPNGKFSADPQILSPGASRPGYWRITYGKHSVQNIEDDIRKI